MTPLNEVEYFVFMALFIFFVNPDNTFSFIDVPVAYLPVEQSEDKYN